MAKQQKYGIKFPITVVSDDNTLFDLNMNRVEQVKSELMHLIFTPKGQRLRKPDFGTRLIQFMFNPSDNETWGDVVSEIKETVKIWIPDCNVVDVEVAEADYGRTLACRIRYTLTGVDGETNTYELVTKL